MCPIANVKPSLILFNYHLNGNKIKSQKQNKTKKKTFIYVSKQNIQGILESLGFVIKNNCLYKGLVWFEFHFILFKY